MKTTMMIKRNVFLVFSLFFICLKGFSQGVGSDSLSMEYSVNLSTGIAPGEVPLNGTAMLTVQLSWLGDMGRVEIGDVETPILTNFDIVGTASGNLVTGTPHGRKATKEIVYTLRPKTLGMAYVESVNLSYVDNETGQTRHMKTQRVGVEVISPVAEPGKTSLGWIWIGLVVLCVGIVFVVVVFFKRRFNEKKEIEIPQQITEEIYLEALKSEIDLKGGETRDSFGILSKLFRRYLAEKYHVPALEATTQDLLNILNAQDLDESLIRKCEQLFQKADVVKFSGQDASQAELEEAYTAVETVLESNLAVEKEKQIREEKSKSKKKLKLFGST